MNPTIPCFVAVYIGSCGCGNKPETHHNVFYKMVMENPGPNVTNMPITLFTSVVFRLYHSDM